LAKQPGPPGGSPGCGLFLARVPQVAVQPGFTRGMSWQTSTHHGRPCPGRHGFLRRSGGPRSVASDSLPRLGYPRLLCNLGSQEACPGRQARTTADPAPGATGFCGIPERRAPSRSSHHAATTERGPPERRILPARRTGRSPPLDSDWQSLLLAPVDEATGATRRKVLHAQPGQTEQPRGADPPSHFCRRQ
jgi:hypothetical protein